MRNKGGYIMKVVCTDQYQKLMVEDGVLQRIPTEGEVIEISEERYKVLSDPKNNPFGAIFVKKLEEHIKEVETAKKEVKKETTAKKTTKKTTKKKAE